MIATGSVGKSLQVFEVIKHFNLAGELSISNFNWNSSDRLSALVIRDNTAPNCRPDKRDQALAMFGTNGSVIKHIMNPTLPLVAAVYRDGVVRIFDLSTSQEIASIDYGGDGFDWKVHWSPDGQFLATAFDGTIQIVDAKTGSAVSQVSWVEQLTPSAGVPTVARWPAASGLLKRARSY